MSRDGRISWSRNGLVAFIDPLDRVYVTWLRCVDGGNWDWVPPVHVDRASPAKPIRVSWAAANYDLAICDERGRVQLVTITSDGQAENRVLATSATQEIIENNSELDHILTTYWLQPEKNLIVPRVAESNVADGANGSANGSANSTANGKSSSSRPWESLAPVGPFHPEKTRNTMVAVDGQGGLRVFVEIPGSRYVEFRHRIPSDGFFLRAALTPVGKNSVLCVVVTSDNTLAAFELVFHWSPVDTWPTNPHFLQVSVHPVASRRIITPVPPAGSESSTESGAESAAAGTAGEDSFKNAGLKRTEQALVTLGAFRAIESDKFEVCVVYEREIQKFVLNQAEEALDSSFFELSDPPANPAAKAAAAPAASKGANVTVWQIEGPQAKTYDVDLVDFVVQRFQTVLIRADGKLETHSLLTTTSVLQLDELQLGFDPTEIAAVDAIGLSPTGACAAVFRTRSVTAANGNATNGSKSDTTTNGTTNGATNGAADNATSKKTGRTKQGRPAAVLPRLVSIRLAADADLSSDLPRRLGLGLGTYYACLVFNSDQYDDMLVVSRQVLAQTPMQASEDAQTVYYDAASRETQRLLSVDLGMPNEPHKVERLVVIPSPSQRWLSFVMALGTAPGWQRTPGCQTVLTMLHLQLLAFSLTWTLKRVVQKARPDLTEAHRAEIHASRYHLESMLGPVKWGTDLAVRIVQEIYEASMSADAAARLAGATNVEMALLSSGVTRYLLRYVIRGMRTLSTAAKNIAEQESQLNSLLSRRMQQLRESQLQAQQAQQAQRTGNQPAPRVPVPAHVQAQALELRNQLARSSNTGATRTLKKVVTQLQAIPFKLDAFERLLSDTDTILKGLLSAPEWDTSRRAAFDSTLIRRAQLPAAFAELLVPRFLDTFRQVLLPMTDVPGMYFHDTSWLELNGTPYPERIDGLRKRVILPTEKVRVCTRCGIASAKNPEATKSTAQWMQLFRRQCVCGGFWYEEKQSEKP